MASPDAPSEADILRAQVATLTDLLAVHEEQASKQFDLIRAQQTDLETRAQALNQVNAELTETTAFLRELYRAMPGMLIVCDGTGVIEAANEAATAVLEVSEQELVGQPIAALFDAAAPLPLGSAATPDVVRTEQTMISKSGARVPVILCVAWAGSEPADSPAQKMVCVALDIRDRKRLELELRQAQKLEAVGRLAAGVAHELNTPVQFVSDNIQFLRDATRDLIGVLEKLKQVQGAVLDGTPAHDAALAAAEAERTADLSYLLEEVPQAFEHALDGLDRAATIVRSMKAFAHPDTKEVTAADLNQAITSTLTIARNEYKYVAEVDTDFGHLPPVECFLGELNQAILNIIVNAAQAIGDQVKGSSEKGRLTLRTVQEGDSVVISIADTGGGIPEHIRDRVYDPFFTTKEVGKGTGQGLAIARSVVVEKHGGTLDLESETGKGTTFFIRLPIRHRRASAEPHAEAVMGAPGG